MKRPLGAQISHMLKDRGVDVIFGIPGVHNQELYRGIQEAGITHVLARHEQGAGFMADGYARATGKPGVAYVITGPGVCNIMTPMGQAYSDSVPMLVISSCLDEVAARKGQLHQMLDQEGAAGCVCDWSETARTAEAAYQLIDRALLEFQSMRPRPKHIQVPIKLLETPAPVSQQESGHYTTAGGTTMMPFHEVVEDLANAKKPLIIFGGGLSENSSDSSPPMEVYVRNFMKRTGAAAFSTYAGRGLVDPQDPMNFGSYLARPDSAAIIGQSDYVIAIATSLAEVDLWRHDLGHSATLVRVDIDPMVLTDRQSADSLFQIDAWSFLFEMNNRLPEETGPKWDAVFVAETRAKWRAEADAERPGIVPICDALRKAVPSDTMIYSDMTQMAYVAKEVWDMDRPGHWHHPYGFGTLGYALPAAIGGAVARRAGNLPTMVIVGDYGFHYTMQELGVAVELGLPIPIILWDNGKLKEIEDSMVRGQIAPNAVAVRNPDFCKLAEAFGAVSAEPRTLAEMQTAVRDAFKADGPTLIRITPEIVA